MVDASEIAVGCKVLIQVGTNQFEAEVFSIEDDLFQVDGEQCGLQVVGTDQIVKILSDDDKPNPAPEKGDVPRGREKRKEAAPKNKKAASEKPLSLVNAAHKVLKEEGRAMSCSEMVEAAIQKGYWKPGAGKTPAQTLYAAILRELKSSNERFRRSEVGGKFCAGS